MKPRAVGTPLLIAVLHASATGVSGQVDPDQGVLEVSGTAQIEVPVDQAHIVLAVETEASDAEQAVAANGTRMEAVIAAVRAMNVEGLEVRTTGFNLQPVYGRPGQGQTATRIERYRAVNNLAVTTNDIQSVGEVLDAAVSSGANRIASLTFRARDTEAARREALSRAVERARSEAEVIADALGRPLGEPLEVRGGAQIPRPPGPMMAFAMEARAAATPVEPGDQTVSASVTIKYRLGSLDGGS